MVKKSKRAGGAFVLADTQPIRTEVVLAIDPGAAIETKTNGLSEWHRSGNDWERAAWSLHTIDALRYVQEFVELYAGHAVLVIEEFRLYPTKLQQQALTELGTAQVIGALRWIVASYTEQPVTVVMQSASIKLAGCKRLGGGCIWNPNKSQGGMKHDPTVHVGKNIHARDAEAHGAYWVKAICRD
jgi:hypothetical protein